VPKVSIAIRSRYPYGVTGTPQVCNPQHIDLAVPSCPGGERSICDGLKGLAGEKVGEACTRGNLRLPEGYREAQNIGPLVGRSVDAEVLPEPPRKPV